MQSDVQPIMSGFTLAVIAVVAGLFVVDRIELMGSSTISLRVMTIAALIGVGVNWITNLTMKKSGATPFSLSRSEGVLVVLICGSVFSLILFWEHLVNKHVPEPYLDEVFHIPQAQRYCQADFTWDDKITTPPGLYVVSIGLMKSIMSAAKCRASDLRATNGVLLSVLGTAALVCRSTIETLRLNSSRSNSNTGNPKDYYSAYAIHTAVNIVLFPPLFFFSGLYYTDVISTCVVLLAYSAFLKNQGLPIIRKVNRMTNTNIYSVKMSSGLIVFLLGLGSLTMRQTNIFWVAVFLGGLDIVRSLKALPSSTMLPTVSGGNVLNLIRQQADKGVVDPPLRQSTIFEWFFCVYSIAITAFFNLRLVVFQLWPYIGMIMAFAGFVVWNGGVVLGDKSNHVATIHLPQMLYIWAFFAFFSAPLLYPYAIETVVRFKNVVMGSSRTTTGANNPIQYQAWFKAILTIAALCVTFAIVHFNTIIHPFTLADNRHYVFYVFRYTILRHPLIKYALAPVYLGCAWLAFLALAGPERPNVKNTSTSKKSLGKTAATHEERSNGFNSPVEQDTTNTSFVIIWLISTALSLMTAPLVEPRYFIIPWAIWRLHIPALPANASETGRLKYWAYTGHDHRLWLETFWFLAINAVTGWVFLYRGFEWPQEPGLVQRFMW